MIEAMTTTTRWVSVVWMLAAVALAGCERAIPGEPMADPRPVRITIKFAEPCHIAHVYLRPGGTVDLSPKDDWTPNRCVASAVEVQ